MAEDTSSVKIIFRSGGTVTYHFPPAEHTRLEQAFLASGEKDAAKSGVFAGTDEFGNPVRFACRYADILYLA
jgi:hypothetical protein